MAHRFVSPEDGRLDKLIAQHTRLSRRRAKRLADHGGVRVDGQVARHASDRVPRGAVIEVQAVPDRDRAPEVPVVYQDDWLLVVNKPSGLPTQAPRHGGRMHLYAVMSAGQRYLGLHHRLDTPASGLVLFTRKREANAAIARALCEHQVRRTYLAVVLGDPGVEGVWDADIAGRRAVCRWRRLGRGQGMSALAVELETGRTHQIRRHAAGAGFPVLGDRRYGGAAGRAWPRLALHHWRMEVAHPATGKRLHLEAPVPDDLVVLLERAGGLLRPT